MEMECGEKGWGGKCAVLSSSGKPRPGLPSVNHASPTLSDSANTSGDDSGPQTKQDCYNSRMTFAAFVNDKI